MKIRFNMKTTIREKQITAGVEVKLRLVKNWEREFGMIRDMFFFLFEYMNR